MKIIIQETGGTVVTVIKEITKVSITDSVKFLELTDVYDKSYIGKDGYVPTVNETTGKLELKEPSGGGGGGAVSSVFTRTGNVTAQSGDYNADQITETASKVFVSPSEKTAIGHSNRSILDAIQEAFTTVLKSSYDGVVSGYNALILTGQRLITSSEITKLSNTSGTNTGDETTATIQSKRPLKTVNGESLEGSGNVTITAGISDAPNDANAYVRSGLAWVVGYTKSAIDSIVSGIQTALNAKEDKTQYFELTSPYTLTNTPDLQSFMGHSFNVVAGTYRFKIRFVGSSFAASGNIQFGCLGTATVTFISWDSNANKQNSFPTTNQIQVADTTSATPITTSSSATNARGLIEGIVKFSTSGTFILAVAMGTGATASIDSGTQELTKIA